mmetsp:Transcript_31516/g.32067  ORF Transcript_31516/g.32067 Transcript_31516/m.32067 type:complete len:191 (+) Transcript_31516:490-1062(+)
MVETFLILMQDHLRKLVVFESSVIANQQYDLQMLFKVFENASPEDDLLLFMTSHDTSYSCHDTPVLSELLSGVAHPDSLPLPPPPGLLACPVSPQIPTVSKSEQILSLSLPLLVKSESKGVNVDTISNLSRSSSMKSEDRDREREKNEEKVKENIKGNNVENDERERERERERQRGKERESTKEKCVRDI